jgi:hypothetical protein
MHKSSLLQDNLRTISHDRAAATATLFMHLGDAGMRRNAQFRCRSLEKLFSFSMFATHEPAYPCSRSACEAMVVDAGKISTP